MQPPQTDRRNATGLRVLPGTPPLLLVLINGRIGESMTEMSFRVEHYPHCSCIHNSQCTPSKVEYRRRKPLLSTSSMHARVRRSCSSPTRLATRFEASGQLPPTKLVCIETALKALISSIILSSSQSLVANRQNMKMNLCCSLATFLSSDAMYCTRCRRIVLFRATILLPLPTSLLPTSSLTSSVP